MNAALEDCLTCRRNTDNFLRISDETNGENIGTIVSSHFWFQVEHYADRVLCTSCWEKIEDFHKFYCEVKQLWIHENLPSNKIIKSEGLFDEDEQQRELFACNLVKVEITNKDSSEVYNGGNPWDDKKDADNSKINQISDTATDSEEDSAVPIAKRYRSVKCETISSKGDRIVRKKRKSKPTRINLNKDETSLQCHLCDPVRSFKLTEGLELHMMVNHPEETEKKFPCDQCEKSFTSEWQLSVHKNWHQKESSKLYCDKCNKYFDSARTLNNHIRASHPETVTQHMFGIIDNTMSNVTTDQSPYVPPEIAGNSSQTAEITVVPNEKRHKNSEEEQQQHDELIKKFCTLTCDKCGFMGEHFYHLEKHYKSEHNVRGYAGCCGRRFYRKRQLFEHCQRHVNPDMFRCELCKKSFTDSDGLEKHNQWIHTPDSEKPFKCDICDATFYKEYMQKNHMKYHLSKEQKRYNCKDCDRSFGAPSYLRTHQEAIHGAASSWVCDVCAKGFPHKSLLESHRLTHSEEGAASLKRQCENCKKWLKNKSSFKRHLRRCLAGGPVMCDLCDKEVANEVSLASHKRLNHTKQPVYTCSYCGKQFKRAIRHKEHEANHRGDVLYACPFCPYTCNSNSNMYTHKKAAHSELWAEKIAERFYKR